MQALIIFFLFHIFLIRGHWNWLWVKWLWMYVCAQVCWADFSFFFYFTSPIVFGLMLEIREYSMLLVWGARTFDSTKFSMRACANCFGLAPKSKCQANHCNYLKGRSCVLSKLKCEKTAETPKWPQTARTGFYNLAC